MELLSEHDPDPEPLLLLSVLGVTLEVVLLLLYLKHYWFNKNKVLQDGLS